MKRRMILVAIIGLCLLVLPLTAYAETSGTWYGLNWSLDDQGTLTLSGSSGAAGWSYYQVNDSDAWHVYRDRIQNAVLESGTDLLQGAFNYCRNLTNVVLPNSVTSISSVAFYCCTGLTSITIPNSVTCIDFKAFDGCSSLASITIPDSVTTINKGAFTGCRSLTSITIPDSVTSIKENAFSGCSSLTSITIPDNVTTICGYTFYGCTGLTSITIPDSVTSIGQSAFSYCRSLTSITIPSHVTSIGNSAFSGCSSLSSISIPLAVKSINENAFSGCNNLTNVRFYGTVDEWNAITKGAGNESLTGATITCIPGGSWGDLTWTLEDQDTLTINGIGSMKSGSPWGRYKGLIQNINIKPGVTNIGSSAFSGCSCLTSITIPDSVTSIDDYSFSGCSSLMSITIPDNVTHIGNYAFSGCTSLTSITIPACVIDIGHDKPFPKTNETLIVDCNSDAMSWAQNNGYSNKIVDPTLSYGYISTNHRNVVKDGAVEPTCIQTGLSEGSHCEVCGDVVVAQEVIPVNPNAHTMQVMERVEPTCTTDGWTEGSKCAVCGEVLVSQEKIPALGHDWVEKERIPATMNDAGKIVYVCSRDSSHVQEERLPALKYEIILGTWVLEKYKPSKNSPELSKNEMYELYGFYKEMTFYKNEHVSLYQIKDGKPNTVEAYYEFNGEQLVIFSLKVSNGSITKVPHFYYSMSDNRLIGNEADAVCYYVPIEMGEELNSEIELIGTWKVDRAKMADGTMRYLEFFVANNLGNWTFSLFNTGKVLVSMTQENSQLLPYSITNDTLTFNGVVFHKYGDEYYTDLGDGSSTFFIPLNQPYTLSGSDPTDYDHLDRLPGDVTGDGKVNLSDVVRLLKYVSGWDVEIVEANSDVTGDGKITLSDVVRLLKYVSNWDVSLE